MKKAFAKRALSLLLALLLVSSLAIPALAVEEGPIVLSGGIAFDLTQFFSEETEDGEPVDISSLSPDALLAHDEDDLFVPAENADGFVHADMREASCDDVFLYSAHTFDCRNLQNPALTFAVRDVFPSPDVVQPLDLRYTVGQTDLSSMFVSATGTDDWETYSYDLSSLDAEALQDFRPRVQLSIPYREEGQTLSEPDFKDFKIEEMNIAPVRASLFEDTSIALTCATEDADIYYTTNDSAANSWTRYTEPIPFSSFEAVTVAAMAVKDGQSSAISTQVLTPDPLLPDANPKGGSTLPSGAAVTLSGRPGVEIYYTKDGSDPAITLDGDGHVSPMGTTTRYTAPIVVSQDTTLRALTRKGALVSRVVSFPYYVGAQPDRYEGESGNNTFETAMAASFPYTLQDATLHNSADVDFYKSTLTGDGTARLTLFQPEGGEKYGLYLYDGAMRPVASCTLSDNQSIVRELAAGDYYVKVASLTPGTYSAKPYTLKFCRQAGASLNLSEMDMLTFCLSADSFYRTSDYGVNQGGHHLMAANYLTSWKGPYEEYQKPYPTAFDSTDNPFIDYPYTAASAQPQYTATQAIYLPNLPNSASPEAFRERLKGALYSYGAVDVSYYSSYTSTSGEGGRYIYDPITPGSNHCVTLVGWDDHIAKENFTYTKEDGTELHPSFDGAWIMKNSWGDDSGDGGYFYISYEDVSLGSRNSPTVFLMDRMPVSQSGSFAHRQYTHAETGVGGECFDPILYGKNRFTAQEDGERISAVGISIGSSDCRYELSVRTLSAGQDENDEANWSAPAAVAAGFLKDAGYYTIPLADTAPQLHAGDRFEILLRLEGTNGNAKFLVESTSFARYGKITYRQNCAAAVYHPGESFVLKNGRWTDTYNTAEPEKSYNLDIRAYTETPAQENSYKTVCSKTAAEVTPSVLPQTPSDNEISVDITGSFPSVMANGVRGGAVEAGGAPELGSGLSSIQIGASSSLPADISTLPDAFDLRDIGVVSYVKNQAELGSCWTFGAIAAAESSLMYRSMGYEKACSILLPANEDTCFLKSGENYQTAAHLVTTEGTAPRTGYDVVTWQYSGDLDAIKILRTQSRSGVKEPLFKPLAEGTVTLTATVNSNLSRAVSMTVHIVKAKPTPEHESDSSTPKVSYTAETKSVAGGSARVTPASAAEGTTVKAVLTPKEGYRVTGVRVTDENGNRIPVTKLAMDAFQFTMPKGKVTVTPLFVKTPQSFENPYSDVQKGDWFYDGMAYMCASGWMNGTGGDSFSPKRTSSRAMACTILARMAGDGEESIGYEKAAAWGKANGITDGKNMDAEITRQQLAAMLFRCAGHMGMDTACAGETVMTFKDSAAVGTWALEAMEWAVEKGILRGNQQFLNPGGKASRAELSVMLTRFDSLR